MQAFLFLAFGVEAFLMSVHKKHDALDQSVHSLLALTMWACAGSILLEMAQPRSVLASAARSLSCVMQGMWMIQVCYFRRQKPNFARTSLVQCWHSVAISTMMKRRSQWALSEPWSSERVYSSSSLAQLAG